MSELLVAVRRRLRWTWAAATLQWAGPAVALVALGLVALGRLRPWTWPEPGAIVLAVAAVAVVAAVALVMRVPDVVAARSADRGLDTHDALAAALAVGDEPGELADRVRARAEHVAGGVSARHAVPLPRAPRRLALSSVLAVGALGLAWTPNPQDDVRRERAAEQAVLADEADDLREAATALEERPGAGDAERAVAESLRALADELDDAGSLAEGLDALTQARPEMAAQVPADLLAQKAAATGLDRSLDAAPLPGTSGGTAAEQLDELSDALAGMTPDERAALAERLDELAATQALGNAAAADALDAASIALGSGDVAGAEAALGEAAAAQVDATASAQAGEAAVAGTAAVDAAAGDIRRQADGGGDQAAGAGQGGSSGQGDGGGQGDGQGTGSGTGQGGGGQGGGGGSPSGDVGAGGTRSGTGSGQGGQGNPTGGSGTGDQQAAGHEQADREVLIYDPSYTDGDQLDAGGSGSGRPGETVGRTDGATGSGHVQVPLSQVIADYQRRATEALGRGDLPPSSQDLIRAYFDAIAGFGD
ncbi:MAG: hypothetical protein JXA83_09125 [Acidimicrobiales bacterium]|nr:hypothetical protein [Acidimicrobiales bacterium]